MYVRLWIQWMYSHHHHHHYFIVIRHDRTHTKQGKNSTVARDCTEWCFCGLLSFCLWSLLIIAFSWLVHDKMASKSTGKEPFTIKNKNNSSKRQMATKCKTPVKNTMTGCGRKKSRSSMKKIKVVLTTCLFYASTLVKSKQYDICLHVYRYSMQICILLSYFALWLWL